MTPVRCNSPDEQRSETLTRKGGMVEAPAMTRTLRSSHSMKTDLYLVISIEELRALTRKAVAIAKEQRRNSPTSSVRLSSRCVVLDMTADPKVTNKHGRQQIESYSVTIR